MDAQASAVAPALFVLASYMRDLSVVVARWPRAGETVVGHDALETPGGKGSNQAIQAARCGAVVELLAGLADDPAGAAACALWAAEGIVATVVPGAPGQATGQAMVIVGEGGENRIVIAPGANTAITPADVDRVGDRLDGARVVLAQLETPLAATRQAFARARAAGALTMLNTAPASGPLDEALWALTDVVIANEGEAAMLCGAAADVDAAGLGPALLARVRVAAVITLGARGAMLWRPGAPPIACPALPVAVVDTTGAGDAFTGAFAARWAAGDDPARALAHGVAAGSLACTRRGVAPALAREAELRAASRQLEPRVVRSSGADPDVPDGVMPG